MGGDVKALGQELERLRIGLEDSVRERASDFSALYVSVCDLHSFCVSHCGHVREDTVSVLRGVMEGREHEKQKLALFLYKEAANALASISVSDEAERDVAEQAAISLSTAPHKKVDKITAPLRTRLSNLPNFLFTLLCGRVLREGRRYFSNSRSTLKALP